MAVGCMGAPIRAAPGLQVGWRARVAGVPLFPAREFGIGDERYSLLGDGVGCGRMRHFRLISSDVTNGRSKTVTAWTKWEL